MSDAGRIERRSIGIVFSDGGLLALTASLPDGARDVSEEEIATVLCNPDGAPIAFEETLLSTEYGADGVQRRVSIELWPDAEGGAPMRGGGTLISSISVRHRRQRSEIAFFRWSVDGREGLGHYEVVRADG